MRIPAGAALLLAAISLVVAAPRPQRARQKPGSGRAAAATEAPARRASLPGVANFAEVSPGLYRGAQPDARGFQELKNLGVAVDVDLRAGREQGEKERRTVEALGMRYVGIRWSSFHEPNDSQVAEFLGLVQANPDEKIFVHCREGRDRTGVMVAAFRIADEHWPAEAAVREMQAFHFHSFWFHSWKSYVLKFPQEFATGASFRPLRAAAPASRP
jgi:tyrosine-protein phosphatase SIW14